MYFEIYIHNSLNYSCKFDRLIKKANKSLSISEILNMRILNEHTVYTKKKINGTFTPHLQHNNPVFNNIPTNVNQKPGIALKISSTSSTRYKQFNSWDSRSNKLPNSLM